MLKFIRNLFKTKMDSSEADYDMLDLLAWNCNQLSSELIDKPEDEQQKIIDEYIKRVDSEFETIKEFKEGTCQFQFLLKLTLNNITNDFRFLIRFGLVQCD